MDIYSKFKPNLIPNSDVSDPIDLKTVVGDNIIDYVVSYKKDGCRIEIKDGELLTRALKPVTSLWIKERYKKLAEKCKELGIILEGEFYSHGMRFPEIVRYFKTEDVTAEKNVKKLLKMEESGKLPSEWPGRSVEWLSTYHPSLKLWPFDVLLVDNLEVPYFSRMQYLFESFHGLNGPLKEFKDLVEFGPWFNLVLRSETNSNEYFPIHTFQKLEEEYDKALELGYEGDRKSVV